MHRHPMGGGHMHRPPMGGPMHRPPMHHGPMGGMGGGYYRPNRYRGGCGCCGPMCVMMIGAIVGICALLF